MSQASSPIEITGKATLIKSARSPVCAPGSNASSPSSSGCWGFNKVRYRGLAKNANRAFVATALANLFLARKHLVD